MVDDIRLRIYTVGSCMYNHTPFWLYLGRGGVMDMCVVSNVNEGGGPGSCLVGERGGIVQHTKAWSGDGGGSYPSLIRSSRSWARGAGYSRTSD